MDSILVFHQLQEVIDIILQNKYNNIITTTLDKNSFTFSITYLKQVICQLTIIKTYENIVTGKTRHSYQQTQEVPVIKILWLETKPEHRNQKLGLLLLCYGILRLKLSDMSICYAVVDDDSANSAYIEKNIYNKLGFMSQGQISLNMLTHNCVNLSGPEKQLEINEKFVEYVKKIVN